MFESIREQRVLRVIGLSSGTSMDGMDAALVEIEERSGRPSVRLLGFETVPYPEDLRRRLLEVARPDGGTTGDLCRLHARVGEAAAAAAEAAVRRAATDLSTVHLIGSHGQTLCHLPEESPRCSLQVGDAAVIAERTGVTTVSNFRARDLAAGGQGAPLVPYVDWLLFRSDEESRVMLNLGGIANVTFLPKGQGAGAVLGFDTGPGNMVLDGIVRVLTGGRESFDRGGARAAKGRVHAPLLEELLRHPYFRLRGPKSTGREAFGDAFAGRLVGKAREGGVSDEDLLATVTELTAATVVQAIVLCVADASALGRLVVSGGGVHNDRLMERLADLMKPVPVVPLEAMGLSSDAKEAVAFAVLARETIHGRPSNLPAVTGARRPVILGDITPGQRP